LRSQGQGNSEDMLVLVRFFTCWETGSSHVKNTDFCIVWDAMPPVDLVHIYPRASVLGREERQGKAFWVGSEHWLCILRITYHICKLRGWTMCSHVPCKWHYIILLKQSFLIMKHCWVPL
jgi:hypothetical protein